MKQRIFLAVYLAVVYGAAACAVLPAFCEKDNEEPQPVFEPAPRIIEESDDDEGMMEFPTEVGGLPWQWVEDFNNL